VLGIGNALVSGAYRNLTLDISGGTATHGATPAGMALVFTGGNLQWGALTDSGPFGGDVIMTGKTGANSTLGLVSWDGNTLTLPVKFLTVGANGLNELWQGSLVATVPEPSTLALGVLGMAGLMVSRKRSQNRSV
jgi:hypothetical protein